MSREGLQVWNSMKHTLPDGHDVNFVLNGAEVYPEIPEDLIRAEDSIVTPDDWVPLHTTQDGNPMCGYPYGSPERLDILRQQKAARRLGLMGIEMLDESDLKALRAQNAMSDLVVSSALKSVDQFVDHQAANL